MKIYKTEVGYKRAGQRQPRLRMSGIGRKLKRSRRTIGKVLMVEAMVCLVVLAAFGVGVLVVMLGGR